MKKKMVFLLWKNNVHIVEVNDTGIRNDAFYLAREKLGVPIDDITPWQECEFNNGVAKFQYKFRS